MELQFVQAVPLGQTKWGDNSELWQFIPTETDVDWLNGTRPLPPFHNSTFTITDLDMIYFQSFLTQLFYVELPYSQDFVNILAVTLFYPTNIPEVMANVAESVTIYLRQNHRNSTTMPGVVWQQATIVEIRWPWLILPALNVLITAALLVSAILSSKSDISAVTSWKSSSLPLLFHGIWDWRHGEWELLYAGKFETIKQMNAVAAKMDVSLCKAVGSGTALARHDLGVDERQADRPTSGQEE